MVSRKQKAAGKIEEDLVSIRELKAFYHGKPGDPVSSVRFYWPAGAGPRENIADHFLAKRRPAAFESSVDTAARVEVLLRGDVPEDYTDPTFLVESYMAKLPDEETSAFAQVTLSFPRATNLHHPWETARAWLREYYVERTGVPVVAILHAPFLAGSESPVHLHALVLTRRLRPATCGSPHPSSQLRRGKDP
jgi:hypothetical protein